MHRSPSGWKERRGTLQERKLQEITGRGGRTREAEKEEHLEKFLSSSGLSDSFNGRLEASPLLV